MVREQVGDNPVDKLSPETRGHPVRTLHRNLLLQVNDLPIEIVQSPAPKTKNRNKRSIGSLMTPEQTLSPETSDSEDDVPLY